jgi:hypothetical protein
MTPTRVPRPLFAACVLALASLGLMAWSVLDPRPVPVIAAMSVGQVLGTLSFAVFLLVVVVDLRRAMGGGRNRRAGDDTTSGE